MLPELSHIYTLESTELRMVAAMLEAGECSASCEQHSLEALGQEVVSLRQEARRLCDLWQQVHLQGGTGTRVSNTAECQRDCLAPVVQHLAGAWCRTKHESHDRVLQALSFTSQLHLPHQNRHE